MTEQARLKRRISAVEFAMWELHLYLDTHPNCGEGTKKLAEYRAQRQKLIADYEAKFGPRNENSMEMSRRAWTGDPWPWETEANE